MRRMRRTATIRELVREVSIARSDLIQPIFIEEELTSAIAINSMPGQNRLALSSVHREAGILREKDIRSVLLFGIPRHKEDMGTSAHDPQGEVRERAARTRDQNRDR